MHDTNQDVLNYLELGNTKRALELAGEVDHVYVDLWATGHRQRDPVTGKIIKLYNYSEQSKDPQEIKRHEEGDIIWTKEFKAREYSSYAAAGSVYNTNPLISPTRLPAREIENTKKPSNFTRELFLLNLIQKRIFIQEKSTEH